MIPIIGVIFGITTVAAAPAEFYQSRYDHIDVESILNNRRMVNYYAACLLSQGPCTPQGVDLKKILPEALTTNCAKCTEKQRSGAYRVIRRLKKEYPKIWMQLAAVWDPDDMFVQKFEVSVENENDLKPQRVPDIFNRFGEDETTNSATNNAASIYPPSTSTATSTTTTTSTTNKPTNKPVITQPPIVVTKPPQAPPFTTVGANLQATVSFGTNLVGGIVRSLGTIGTKVVESGTKIANMVISAAFRPI